MATFREGIVPYAAILGAIAALMANGAAPFRYGAAARHRRGDDVRRRHPQLLGRSAGFALVAALVIVRLCDRTSSPTTRAESDIWLDPFNEEWMRDKGYQIRQSLLSIGSGGLFGAGPWQEPAEVSVPARRAQRLHLRHHLRRARLWSARRSSWSCSRCSSSAATGSLCTRATASEAFLPSA